MKKTIACIAITALAILVFVAATPSMNAREEAMRERLSSENGTLESPSPMSVRKNDEMVFVFQSEVPLRDLIKTPEYETKFDHLYLEIGNSLIYIGEIVRGSFKNTDDGWTATLRNAKRGGGGKMSISALSKPVVLPHPQSESYRAKGQR